jgi:hypothetical protein
MATHPPSHTRPYYQIGPIPLMNVISVLISQTKGAHNTTETAYHNGQRVAQRGLWQDIFFATYSKEWRFINRLLCTQSRKGLCPQMNIFLKAYKIRSFRPFCKCENSFYIFSFVQEKNKYKVCVCFFENTDYFWKLFQKPLNSFLYRLPTLPLVDFLQCPPLIECRKNPRNCTRTWPRRLPDMIFQDHRRVPVSVFHGQKSPLQSIWRRLLEGFSQ